MRAHRAGLIIVLAIGVFFAVVPFALEMPAKTQAADAMTNDFRPLYRARSQYRSHINTLQAMAEELGEMPPEQKQELGSPSLATADGATELAGVVGTFKLFVTGLELTAPDFRLADQVPIKPLPATAVHYIFLMTGMMFIMMGAAGLLFPGATRRMLGVSVLMGPMLIATALLWNFPVKTQAVDNLTGGFRLFMTTPVANRVRAEMDTLQSMADELAQRAMPASLAATFPAVADGISQLDTAVPAFEKLTSAIEGNVGNFRLADALPTELKPATTMHWLFVYPAVLLILGGSVALMVGRGARVPALGGRELDLRVPRADSAASTAWSFLPGDGAVRPVATAHQHSGAVKEISAWKL